MQTGLKKNLKSANIPIFRLHLVVLSILLQTNSGGGWVLRIWVPWVQLCWLTFSIEGLVRHMFATYTGFVHSVTKTDCWHKIITLVVVWSWLPKIIFWETRRATKRKTVGWPFPILFLSKGSMTLLRFDFPISYLIFSARSTSQHIRTKL